MPGPVMLCLQNAQESEVVQEELTEKVERLNTELGVFKSLMTDVSPNKCYHTCTLDQIPNMFNDVHLVI